MAQPVVPEDVFRVESGRVLGALMRRFGDLDLAEDAYQDACLAALETWPRDGVPTNPGAWLTTAARNKALDRLRREQQRLGRETESMGLHADRPVEPATPSADELADLGDPATRARRRRPAPAGLPVLPPGAGRAGAGRADTAHGRRPDHHRDRPRVPGARVDDGAAAGPGQAQDRRRRHPVPTARGRRAHRADRGGAARGLPGIQRGLRGQRGDRRRAARARRPVRGGAAAGARCSGGCCPTTPRSTGLLALLLLHDARRATRTDDAGRLVPLAEQDRASLGPRPHPPRASRWWSRRCGPDRSGRTRSRPRSPRCTRRRRRTRRPTGRRSSRCTGCWSRRSPDPTVRLNRAVAVVDGRGTAGRARRWSTSSSRSGELVDHHRLHAVRAHLLEEAGRPDEAVAAYDRAAELSTSTPERDYLRMRRDRLLR